MHGVDFSRLANIPDCRLIIESYASAARSVIDAGCVFGSGHVLMEEVPFIDPSASDFSIRSCEVRNARQKSWYARTPYGIAVLRYEEMRSLLLHPSLRQGSYKWPDHCGAFGIWAKWWKRIMLNLEGEDHARLRRLAQPAFAPRRVSSFVPEFQNIADRLISAFERRGRCDFMKEFAEPYASKVICLLMGIPDDRWRELSDLTSKMGLALGVTYNRDEEIVDEATAGLFRHAESIVYSGKVNSKSDFIGDLIKANRNKDAFSDQELRDMIVLLIFGGIDTTRNQLGFAMHLFIEHPSQWELLSERPDLARKSVDEVMRLRPTITWVTREAIEDFEFEGLRLAKGTTIHLFSESAGTDPNVFSEGMDILAERRPHFGFGAGKHHCIGSPVARTDMAEALKLLARRIRHPAMNGAAKWLPDSGNTGPVSLPIKFKQSDQMFGAA